MKRILIVKFWAMGDILMATPILRALKAAWPDCHVSWLVDMAYADVLHHNPFLDEVIPFDSGAWRREFRYFRVGPYWKMSRRLQDDLRARRFDIVLNLTAEKWWGLWLGVAPVRIGLFPTPHLGWMRRFYTEAIPRPAKAPSHNSRHYLRVVRALGIEGPFDERLALGVSPESVARAEAFLCAQPGYDPAKPLLLLHPGTSQASKCWPAASYAAVAKRLKERFSVVVTGSPRERALAEEVVRGAGTGIVAAGELTHLGDTAALAARAAVVVTGDTSMLHIASALETPLLGIYGSTRPADNAPLFGSQRLLFDDSVPCAPCKLARCPLGGADHLRCQRAITPERVVSALNELLERPE